MQELYLKIIDDLKTIDFIQEFVLGSCAGFAICLVGHPFDTIKTRMQNSNKSLIYTIKSTFIDEGLFAFYKGMGSPLFSTPLINAVVFTSYEVSKVVIQNNTKLSEMNSIALAGSVAGFFNSFITGPVELFKTKLQVQGKEVYYKSYIDIAIKLHKVSGIKGWFQGTYATMIRDTISIGAQFWAYEYVLEQINNRYSFDSDKKVTWPYLVAGSAAGISCWVSSYPIDVVKSRIQARIMDSKLSMRFNGNIKNELSLVYRLYGMRGLFAGIVPIMGRAGLANAAGFWTWEHAKTLLRGNHN